MGTLFRVLIGYIAACLVLPLVLLAFANNMPGKENLFDGDVLSTKLPLLMFIVGVFGLPFSLIALAYGESRHRSDWLYYAVAGIVVALIGYFALCLNQAPGTAGSITDTNMALISFITAGFAAGLTYWLFSGRLVGIHIKKPQPAMGRPGSGPDANRKPGAPNNTPNAQRR